MFKLNSKYHPNGDQPRAINTLHEGLENDKKSQVLLGVTGSGKTFTIANIIEKLQKPTLIMAHNKTLAAQLYGEMKEFFPDNAVEYFVSYYDYYQPEAYIAKTDTYIEKDSAINEQLDLLRHSATVNLLERKDVIVVSSVSCIYGIGDKENYSSFRKEITVGQALNRDGLVEQLINMQYERVDSELERGKFRIRGATIDLFPCHLEDNAWKIKLDGNKVEAIYQIDYITNRKLIDLQRIVIYPNKHFTTPIEIIKKAIKEVKHDLSVETDLLLDAGKWAEAKRLEQRTSYDMEMLLATGSCKGVENYSRYFDGRKAGEPPSTLFSYFPKDALLVVDESHITAPQIGGMFAGDRARKENLVSHGFRLQSAFDNRPLKFEEWDSMRPRTIFVSATPAKFEMELVQGEVAEQIIRPTGLLDPVCEIRPTESQVMDLAEECKKVIKTGGRVLALTITKKWAERLNDYLNEDGIKSSYLHSEIKTFQRVEIINKLRAGDIDVIVGINLLREGIDIPECSLVAILDGDKEGFLRNESSLIQIIGRAARNENGRVVIYADKITKSIEAAMNETSRRREIQQEHNRVNNIIPITVKKELKTIFDDILFRNNKARANETRLEEVGGIDSDHLETMSDTQIDKHLNKLKRQMKEAAKKMDFDLAAKLRDKMLLIQKERIS